MCPCLTPTPQTVSPSDARRRRDTSWRRALRGWPNRRCMPARIRADRQTGTVSLRSGVRTDVRAGVPTSQRGQPVTGSWHIPDTLSGVNRARCPWSAFLACSVRPHLTISHCTRSQLPLRRIAVPFFASILSDVRGRYRACSTLTRSRERWHYICFRLSCAWRCPLRQTRWALPAT